MTLGTHLAFAAVLYLGGATRFGYPALTPLLAQLVALRVVFIALILLLRIGDRRGLQCRGVAEPDRQRETERQRLAARWPRRFPPSWKPPTR